MTQCVIEAQETAMEDAVLPLPAAGRFGYGVSRLGPRKRNTASLSEVSPSSWLSQQRPH